MCVGTDDVVNTEMDHFLVYASCKSQQDLYRQQAEYKYIDLGDVMRDETCGSSSGILECGTAR